MTFHAACGRILRREAQRLGYRSNFTIYDTADQLRLDEAVPRGARARPEALHAARHPLADLEREEPADRPGRVRGARRELLRPDGRRRLRAVPAQALRVERRRLRRHALPHRRRARALPRGAGEVAEGVPLRARRRVPGHEPRAVPVPAAARRAAHQRLRRRRPGSVDLRVPRRRHPQRPRVRDATSRARSRSRSSRTTARRTRSSRPRTPSSRTTASASRRTSGRSSATASRCASSRSRTSTPRRATSPPRSRVLVEEGYSGSEIAVFYRTNAQSRVLEDVLVRQGVAYQVIGGPRFYERAEVKDLDRVPAGDRQPVRRRLAAARSRTGRAAGSATRRSRS